MLDWSYDYVLKRHAEERAKREANARFFVEKWLEALVGPHLTKPAPLPQRFEQGNLSFFSKQETFCSAEVIVMAGKLGWNMQVTLPPSGCTDALVIVWQTGGTRVPSIDSKWDLEAVRAQKKRNDDERLKDVHVVISKAVENRIGDLTGIPESFPLDVTADWVKEHSDDLALLGWKAGTCPAGFFYLRKA